ncbi:MAG: Maf family protein [Planctomycetaceae bacterium]|nr:Maf family protein [Planctomycetaceae bacterium]
MSSFCPIVLGSTSPRRQELIQQLFPNRQISIVPPHNPDEMDLSDLTCKEEIAQGLLQIACDKNDDVCHQLSKSPELASSIVLTADTAVVVCNDSAKYQILGKPPTESYREVVRSWFEQYYLGKTHDVITAVCLSCSGQQLSCTVTSQVTMAAELQNRISWYLDTKESLGKAGGYAIQGVGSLFVEQVTGSITNVIGLPLKETLELVEQADRNFFAKGT